MFGLELQYYESSGLSVRWDSFSVSRKTAGRARTVWAGCRCVVVVRCSHLLMACRSSTKRTGATFFAAADCSALVVFLRAEAGRWHDASRGKCLMWTRTGLTGQPPKGRAGEWWLGDPADWESEASLDGDSWPAAWSPGALPR